MDERSIINKTTSKLMPLIPWRRLSDLEKFFEEEDWIPPALSRRPAMNIYETDKEVIVEMNLPGFDPEKMDISIERDLLKIKGSIEEKKEEKEKDYWKKEIHTGSFERISRLPAIVKENSIEATYEKGVLKIIMPKIEMKPSSKVKVKIKEN